MKIYPLKFKPIYKERLWGGDKLRTELQKDFSGSLIGESWEISDVPGSISVVVEGPLKGKTLRELISVEPDAILGKIVKEKYGLQFPILIKFIDAQQDLSIQLHPDDDLALKRHQSLGKTEMWYIMQAEQDAKLIVGFNREMDKDRYVKALGNDTLLEVLKQEPVKKGDCFFIETGTIHAIGAGTLLAEIQQTSDVTYRVYDFKRKDKDGNYRELHTELALDAIHFNHKNQHRKNHNRVANTTNELVRCNYFSTQYLPINKNLEISYANLDSFVIYVCVSGTAEVTNAHGNTSIKKGESILIPASCNQVSIKTSGVEFLEVYMPV